MVKTDNQPPKSKRELLNERLAGKYPDKDFTDEESFYGQISDDYDNYDNELNGYKEREKSFSDMFTSDPRSAAFMTDWKNGEDPVVSLVRKFGPDIKEAFDDEEQMEALAKASEQYYDRMTKAQELEDAYNTNWPQTMDYFNQAIEEGKMSEQDVDDVFEFLRKIVDDGIVGKFTPETIDLALKALKHDTDVADAERTGEVRGRNAKITEKLRKASKGDGTAPLDGQNGKVNQAPKRDLGALGRMTDAKSIWDS